MNKNSVNTPTTEDIKIKIKDLIKESPENWLDLLVAKTGKSPATIKAYIYSGRGRKKQMMPVLKAMNEIVEEFDRELQNELAK